MSTYNWKAPCNNVLSRLSMVLLIHGKVPSINLSMSNTKFILEYKYDHNYFFVWLLANPYINDQSKNIKCLVSQNVNFRLNTLLHGALQLPCKRLLTSGIDAMIEQLVSTSMTTNDVHVILYMGRSKLERRFDVGPRLAK